MAQVVGGTGSVRVGPRLRGVRWGLGAVAAAVAVACYGAYGDPRHIASQERAVPYIVAVLVVAGGLVFGLLVPAALRGLRAGSSRWAGGGLALAVVAVLSLVGFWSGLPLVLGTAAGLLGAEGRHGSRRGLATATLAIGVLVVVANVIMAVLGNLPK